MRPTDKPGGTVFSDPLNPHNNIRVMPGNPNSPHPSQQVPYVKFVKDGKNHDVNGKQVTNGKHPDAHIPLTDFDMKKCQNFKYMNEVIMENIYSNIIEISDISIQRKLWLNENNDTGLISSYIELMCQLFDDYGFNDFVDKSAREFGLSEQCILELDKLRIMLKNYKEGEKSDREIIEDLEWVKIVDQAKIVIENWNLST